MRRREFITLLDNAGAENARLCAVVDEIVATHPDLVISRSTPASAALMHAAHEQGVTYLRCECGG